VGAVVAWVGVVVELFDDGLQIGGSSIGALGVALALLFDKREVFFDQPGAGDLPAVGSRQTVCTFLPSKMSFWRMIFLCVSVGPMSWIDPRVGSMR
jgi:hypothetical protein